MVRPPSHIMHKNMSTFNTINKNMEQQITMLNQLGLKNEPQIDRFYINKNEAKRSYQKVTQKL